ncbi:MAG: hypothetical protein IPN62_06370 [Flavobacteriales bacterium]|nr:hypothetical protein [Flavobacteriales bacterium]
MRTDLGVPLDDGIFRPLSISAPVRGRKFSSYQQRAFETVDAALSGTFTMNMEYASLRAGAKRWPKRFSITATRQVHWS